MALTDLGDFLGGTIPTGLINAIHKAIREIQPLYIAKTIPESISNNTLQDDDELALSVEANAVYRMEAMILYTAGGAAATNGIKIGWSGPSGATMDWVTHGKIDTDGTNSAASIWMAHNTIGSTQNLGGAGATEIVIRPTGRLVTSSTAGTFRFRWSQATTNATATVVLANSDLLLRRIG